MTTTADRAVVAPSEEIVAVDPGPRWPRPALAALLVGTAVLYLWGLSASGYGNTFYAAAAQAGAQSWKAWFFGSLDAGNFVTVDKPPAATWLSVLSVRLFGMNPWAVLAPQAFVGVAAVAVLYLTVRRAVSDPRLGAAAGLLAGATLAVTPAAVLIFRYNNPDALMTLLMLIGAYGTTRATRTASSRWLTVAGVALGFAFLTKMLAGLMVLPAFAATYLCFAPEPLRKRLNHLLIAGMATLLSAGWWVLVVELWPTADRPYVSNSTDNSVLNLAVGYNGVNRLVGRNGPDHHMNTASHAGLRRLFTGEMGNEISWLLPTALLVIAFAVYLWRRGALQHAEKSALVLWSGWIALCGTVFTYMDGMAHPYYTVAMAPAVSALVGLGAVWAWRSRAPGLGAPALALMIALAAGWSIWLLHRSSVGPPQLRWLIGVTAVCAVGALGLRWWATATTLALLAALAGVTTFGAATAATPHTGSMPTAVVRASAGRHSVSETVQASNLRDNSALAHALRATRNRWSAATVGSQTAAALEISSGTSVMAIGGWRRDPVPTVGDFIDAVRAGRVGYFVEDGRGTQAPYARDIEAWVARHYPIGNIGGATVYRLS